MNEQRLEAYLDLIQTLLSCPVGQEATILNAHPGLVDEDLVQTIKQVSAVVGERGDQETADWLRHTAEELDVSIGNSSTATQEEYRHFLLQVLQAVSEKPHPQVIYPLLCANLDKLDEYFVQVLHGWATTTLSKMEPVQAQCLAADIFSFSVLVKNFPLGDQAINLEIAITGYEVVAAIYTPEAFPQQWLTTQKNLGLAYSERVYGNQEQNLEASLEAFKAALCVCTREAFPKKWAQLKNYLGNIYLHRTGGVRGENLEAAIAAYEAALQVLTREASPNKWAEIQNNLGCAYSSWMGGDRDQNLEAAIVAYQAALTVFTREASPKKWAKIQNNLGNAYFYRMNDDRAENLEAAITAYEAALEVCAPETLPQDWAETQHNLGAAYLYRIHGDRTENLERAVCCYRAALQFYTREAGVDCS